LVRVHFAPHQHHYRFRIVHRSHPVDTSKENIPQQQRSRSRTFASQTSHQQHVRPRWPSGTDRNRFLARIDLFRSLPESLFVTQ